MTDVWMTRRGGKYHRVPACQGILDGQAKAASEGFPNHPVERIDLTRAATFVKPCLICWRETFIQDRWVPKALEAELVGDSSYELDFLNGVLRRTRIDPDDLHVQYETNGSSGRRYRIDFAILRDGLPGVAIEIDGFQKDKARNEADEMRQGAAASRQNDLIGAGWVPLRFTNRQVTTSPGQCRADIEMALAQLRRSDSPTPVISDPALDPSSSSTSVPTRPKGRWLKYVVGALTAAVIITVVVLVANRPDSASDSNSVNPSGSSCPSSHPIKGNVAESGERIYHEPGWRYYDATIPEECFASSEDAEAGGYRASEVH